MIQHKDDVIFEESEQHKLNITNDSDITHDFKFNI